MPKQFTPDREDRLKLYEINDEMDAILSVDSDAEFDPDRLDELDIMFDEKASGCVAFIKNLIAHQKAIKAEIERLEAKVKTAANDEKSLKAYLLGCMQRADRQKAGNVPHTARIQANTQPTITVMDEHLVPDRFVEMITKVDKRAIAKWLKDTGEIVDGTEVTEGEHLRIG